MTDSGDAILSLLPAKLKAARQQKALSLEAVAKLSGVSKSMLSQIERGESSPTISTLWNLTRALQVDFAGLLDNDTPASRIAVLRADEAPTIVVRGSGCKVRILSPPEDAGSHEVYELEFKPGDVLDSQPHTVGAREHLTAIEGSLRVTSGDSHETLHRGDSARYPADVAHRIASKDGARAILIVKNG